MVDDLNRLPSPVYHLPSYILTMKTISITTSHRVCGCAIADDERILGNMNFAADRRCVEELTGRIEALLKECGVQHGDLDGVAVDIGPGMLTGLKIGVVTAKTYAQVLNLPIVGISSFQVLADGAPPDFTNISVVIHSSRDQYFFAMFCRNGKVLKETVSGGITNAADIVRWLESGHETIYVTGGGVEKLRGELSAVHLVLAGEDDCLPKAKDLAQVALSMFRSGQGTRYNNINPLYICATNAEKDLANKSNK
ncbi:MAG: tRNA (adenosine(37)-N6)-threonylcarbamoyltransferase complex dimerization subunit type 1 TsaB [bacterium]